MGMRDGGLGLARLEGSTLSLWSLFLLILMEMCRGWKSQPLSSIGIFLSMHSPSRLIFLAVRKALWSSSWGQRMGCTVFDLKFGMVRKVCDYKGILSVVPYTTLYTPALRAH